MSNDETFAVKNGFGNNWFILEWVLLKFNIILCGYHSRVYSWLILNNFVHSSIMLFSWTWNLKIKRLLIRDGSNQSGTLEVGS